MWDDYESTVSERVLKAREVPNTDWKISDLIAEFTRDAQRRGVEHIDHHGVYTNPSGGPALLVSVSHATKNVRVDLVEE